MFSLRSRNLKLAVLITERRGLSTDIPDWPYPIHASERLHDRQSIFAAHASALPSETLIPRFLKVLTASPKLKTATHCIYAYRTSNSQSITLSISKSPRVITGKHDGGERGGGNRLARLLDETGCENTVIVVWRWYGGKQLGSDRWRRITEVAKEALAKGGFLDQKGKDKENENLKRKNRKRK